MINSETVLVAENGSINSRKPLQGCMTISVSRLVSFVFFILCFCLHLISFSTPYWYEKTDNGGYFVSFGLWTVCKTGFFTENVHCQGIYTGRPSQLSFEMRAFQTNMTLALIANVLTLGFYVVWFRIGRGRGSIAYLTPGMSAFGGLTTIIAVSVFGVYFASDLSILSWSFILACVSGGIQLLTGLITLFMVPCVRV